MGLRPIFYFGVEMGKASQQLHDIIEPAVTALGYELVGVEHLAQGRHSMLRIYIDSAAGITVDDCAKVSHQVSAVLDVEDPIHGHYTLEVSSPGLDRPLFTAEHYRRYVGNEIQVRLHAPLQGRRKFKGILREISDDDVVVLEVDGTEYRLPLGEIEKANLVPQW
jgi:ribosome maturation factor RimP